MAGEADEPEVIDRPADDAASEQGQQGAEAAENASSDDPVTAAAVKAGWKPKDQWKGDTTNWSDAPDYLAGLGNQNKTLKGELERQAKVAAQAIETNKRRAIEDARRQIAEAAESGDAKAAIEAAQNLERATSLGSTPKDEFKTRNPWFETDTGATAFAVGIAQTIADQGGSAKEQLEAAEAAVRKRFPELFEDSDAAPEVRPSRGAPHVQSGTRTASAPRKKGWADMPDHARQLNEKAFVKKGLMTREEIADAYWQENG